MRRTTFRLGFVLACLLVAMLATPAPAPAQDSDPADVPTDALEIVVEVDPGALGIMDPVSWLDRQWLGNSCFDWLLLVAVLCGSVVIGAVVSGLLKWQANRLGRRNHWETAEIFCRAIHRPVLVLAMGIGLWSAQFFMDLGVNLAEGEVGFNLHALWTRLLDIIFALTVGWMIYRFSAVVEHWLLRLTGATASQIDDRLAPILLKAIKALLFVTGLLYVLRNGFHRDVSALVAGLGLTGLAIALASQHMVGHLFGSVMILMDNSFQLGDTITVAGVTGTVEDVGLRSTRILTPEGKTVAIPNGTIANTTVTRDAVGDRTRRFTVKVTGAAEPARLTKARELLAGLMADFGDQFDRSVAGGVFFRDADVGGMSFEVIYAFAGAEGDPDGLRAFNDTFNTALLERFTTAELPATFTK